MKKLLFGLITSIILVFVVAQFSLAGDEGEINTEEVSLEETNSNELAESEEEAPTDLPLDEENEHNENEEELNIENSSNVIDSDNDETVQEEVVQEEVIQEEVVEQEELTNEQKAVQLVREYLEIAEDDEVQVVVDHEDNGKYYVQVFDIEKVNGVGHTITRGWYTVDLDSGRVEQII